MNKKKLLALLMALVMTFSLVPVTAFADGSVARVVGGEEYATLQDAIDHAASGSTIELLADINDHVTIREGQNITLNLNDHSVTYNDTPIIVYGKLTVEDVENNQIGSIKSNNNCGIAVCSGGELVFNGGDVTAQEMAVLFSGPNARGTINGGSFAAIDNAVFGTNGSTGRGGNVITINDGVFYGGIVTEDYVACGIYAANNDTWYVNGGQFYINGGAGIVARAGVVNVSGDVSIETSGNVTGKVGDSQVLVPCSAIVFDSRADYPGLDDSSIINISGGNFNSYDDDDNPVATVNEVKKEETAGSHISISGGEFFSDPGDSFIADGYAAVKKHDEDFDADYWTVDLVTYVAQIGDTQYETLQEAFDAGGNVTLLKDVDLSAPAVVKKTVNLDMANHTINNVNDIWAGGNWSLISVQTGGDLTVTGNGTVRGKEEDCYAFDVRDGGKLTIENGNFVGNISAVYVTNEKNIGVSELTVKGGTFSLRQLSDEATDKHRFTLNCRDENYKDKTATITVMGGTFTEFDPSNCQAEGPSTNFVPEGYEVVNSGNGTYTVQRKVVAKIGDVNYPTLQAAFTAANAAQSKTTITLLDDVSLTEQIEVNGNVVLNLNDNDIETTHRLRLVTGSFEITGTGSIITTNPGMAPVDVRFDTASDKTANRTLIIGENVTLNGPCYGLNIFGTNNDAVANDIDVTINGTVNGMLFVLGNLKNTNNDIDIVVNGTVDASGATGQEAVHTGIALNGNANVTVSEDAIVKGESGIEVRAGRLTVNGGTITATADSYSYVPNGNGTTTKGAAIAVAQHNTKLAVNATLNDGTLTGVKQIIVTDVNNDMSDVNVVASESDTQNSVIPEGYKWVDGPTEGTKTLAKVTYVAQIGSTKYETLADAVKEANSDDIIELLANVDLTATVTINKNLTINLNNWNIASTDARALHVKSGDVTITGQGKISASGNTLSGSSSVIRVGDGLKSTDTKLAKASLTIDQQVTVESDKCYGVSVFGVNDTGLELTVNGTIHVTGESNAVANSGNSWNTATTMIINGTVTSDNSYAIYHPGKGTLTVTGTVTGKGGIEAKGGTVTIGQNAHVTATATTQSHKANGNGPSTSGYAIAAVENGGYQGDASVEINGGFITGPIVVEKDSDASWTPSISITGGKFRTEPAAAYVAEGYKAASIMEGLYLFQVGKVEANATTHDDPATSNQVTYTVGTVVKDEENNEIDGSKTTNMQVAVKGTDSGSYSNVQTDSAKQPVGAAALSQLASEKVDKIVAAAVEAAGAKAANNMSINVVLVSDAGTQTKDEQDDSKVTKVTYEVHPEAIVYSAQNAVIGSYHITNDQLKENTSFEVTLPVDSSWEGKTINITHTKEDGEIETIQAVAVNGSVTFTVSEFSQFELEPMSLDIGDYGRNYVTQSSLILDGYINVAFYVHLDDKVVNDPTVAIVLTQTSHMDTIKEMHCTISQCEPAGNNVYKVVFPVAAKDMDVKIQLYLKDQFNQIISLTNTGSYATGDGGVQYAVTDYLAKKATSDNQELRELVEALYAYHETSLFYFDHRDGAATYERSVDHDPAALPSNFEPTPRSVTAGDGFNGLSIRSTSLMLVSGTTIRFYFKLASGHNISEYAFRCGNTVLNPQIDGSTYYVEVPRIAAKDLDKQQTVTVTQKSNDATYTVTYGPFNYIKANANKTSNGLNDLVAAIYWYQVKAAVYFANN